MPSDCNSWLIRPLAPDEIERVATVLGLARLDQGDGFYLVAWEDDELGHGHLALADPPELQDVAVRPEYRRRGVASALTVAAEGHARARGFDRLRLTVSVDNAAAQSLYRSLGYVDCGVPPKRVQGTIVIRTGPLEVDDTLLTWEKTPGRVAATPHPGYARRVPAPTQRERMVAGELYEASDPELIDGRSRARQLTARFNATPQESEEQRLELMRELFAGVGAGAWIEPPFQCDYGWNISLGERVFMNFNCVILDCAPVAIGALTKLGPAVQLCTAAHPVDPDERATGREYARPITIGTNVWIGASVVVGPGVTIHDECVIGAGSVVLDDVPARAIAAGAPCRVLRTV